MSELNNEWAAFMNSSEPYENENKSIIHLNFNPECSDLYISTQTKIGFLNKTIPLEYIFWKLPMIGYQAKQGIIKK